MRLNREKYRNTDKANISYTEGKGCWTPSLLAHPPSCTQLEIQLRTEEQLQQLLWETRSSQQTWECYQCSTVSSEISPHSTKILLLGPEVCWKPERSTCRRQDSHSNQAAAPGNIYRAHQCTQRPTLLVSFFFAVSSARSSSVGGPSIVPCSRLSRSISLSNFMLWVNLCKGQRVGDMVKTHLLHNSNAWGWCTPPRPAAS